AAALPDIGQLFPDSDMAYKDIDSMKLLARAAEKLREEGYRIVNVDATLIMQQPKVSTYKARMSENIAAVLAVESGRVNVKATTTERLGPFGRGEGIGAQAVCMIARQEG
ncbi:MAG: 2-C-methyl-D-erythritol 2,4-cyclodiphosphate synthase, partial [Christensenellaceae bacterium]|nr:2-C-methyl-D-erythritol 2,4-cyclodiphosphate synthase [Christensenellaceae bacterium]